MPLFSRYIGEMKNSTFHTFRKTRIIRRVRRQRRVRDVKIFAKYKENLRSRECILRTSRFRRRKILGSFSTMSSHFLFTRQDKRCSGNLQKSDTYHLPRVFLSSTIRSYLYLCGYCAERYIRNNKQSRWLKFYNARL